MSQYLLFHEIEYDFDSEQESSLLLPFDFGFGLLWEQTPDETLERLQKSEDRWRKAAGYVILPEYSMGVGLCHRCIKTDSDRPKPFQNILAVLRLAKPIGFSVASIAKIESVDEEPTVKSVSLIIKRTPWRPKYQCELSCSDLLKVKQLLPLVEKTQTSDYEGLRNAYVFFAQVSTGFASSFQLAYMGLFMGLEALFRPSNTDSSRNYGRTLADRVNQLLPQDLLPNDCKEWLEDEYKNGRNKIAHGDYDLNPNGDDCIPPEKSFRLGRLHEILRLSLLAFYGMDEDVIKKLGSTKGKERRVILDNLPTVNKTFLENERMWSEGL